MSLDPEFLKAILDDAEEDEYYEYGEDFHTKLSQSPAFDRVKSLQADLLETPLNEDELVDAWQNSQTLLGSLELEAREAGLLHKIVILRGRGIEIPKFDINLTMGAVAISVVNNTEIDKDMIERYYSGDEIRGLFLGYTLKYQKVEDDTYRARLAYQILINGVRTPHAQMNLCATGFVGMTELSFEEDEKLEAVSPILDGLSVLCPDQLENLNHLNAILAVLTKHDGISIRRVARLAEKIISEVKGEESQMVEDEIIELITQYVEMGIGYEIVTPSYSLSAVDHSSEPEYFQKKDYYAVVGPSTGMVFMPKTVVKNGKPTFMDKKVLNIVLAHNGRNLYIPLTKAKEFGEG